MSRAETVERAVADAAASIESAVEDVDGFDEWVRSHGLGRADSPTAIVARQAAFHVVLVAALYETYRSEGGGSEGVGSEGAELPPLEASSYREMVAAARRRTGDESFSPYFLTRVAGLFGAGERERLIGMRERFVGADDPAEAIGRVHESLVPQADRRTLGQFRTPPTISDLMAAWVVRSADDVVLDPGVGAAALSTSAYAAKRSREGTASPDEMNGVEVSPLSVLMADTSIRLSNAGGRPRLHAGNFLDLEPDEVGAVDAVISNPPYTRHHELDEAEKAAINRRMEAEAGRSISALSPLYAYFYVHATQFLAEGGRTTFVTPSEFLETNYGEDLKAFLLENYHLRAFVLYDRGADSQFDEALTTSFVSFLERKGEEGVDDGELTKFVRVDEWPGRDVVLEAVEDGTEGETGWGFVNTVRQADLAPEDKWDDLYDPVEIGEDERLVPLEEIGSVRRGIATGKNDFFCLSEADREGSSEGFEWEIDDEFLSKLIRNSGSVPHYDYRDADWERQREAGDEVWLLYHLEELDRDARAAGPSTGGNSHLGDFAEGEESDESVEGEESDEGVEGEESDEGVEGEESDEGVEGEESDEGDENEYLPGVADYLHHGASIGVGADDSYLARNRSPWFVVDRRDPAPILYTYMSRSRGRFVHNRTSARNLNNLHGVSLDVELDETQVKALLGYLNSPFADEIVKRSGRTYSTGMDKVEPAELEGVPVVDPRTLSHGEVERLAGLFDDLCEASRDGDEDRVLDELGDALDDVLED